MSDERRQAEEQDDVKVPEEAIEDLAPEGDETAEVKGGAYQWWMKVEDGGPDQ